LVYPRERGRGKSFAQQAQHRDFSLKTFDNGNLEKQFLVCKNPADRQLDIAF
jgi:hypothetical protein